MAFVTKASNAFARVRTGLAKAAPVLHAARKWGDAIGGIAAVTPLPGAGIVRAVTRGLAKVDDVAQKLASA